MEISFADDKLQNLCEQPKLAQRKLQQFAIKPATKRAI